MKRNVFQPKWISLLLIGFCAILAIGVVGCIELQDEEKANKPPVIDSLTVPAAVVPGESVTFRAIAHDLDGDTLTYAWTVDGTPLSDTTPIVTWTVPDVENTVTVTVSVSDGKDRPIIQKRELTIQPKPEPPPSSGEPPPSSGWVPHSNATYKWKKEIWASISKGYLETHNGMSVSGKYGDIIDTAEWGINKGHIWRIFIGSPLVFTYSSSDDYDNVWIYIYHMPLTGGNRRSNMLLKINGSEVNLTLKIEDGLGGSRGDIGKYVKKGLNRIEVSSAPGTGLKHGLQNVIVKYFSKTKA